MRPPILLDTNLLILLAVGSADTEYISKHKRLKAYDIKDFEILDEIISQTSGIILTPNVLTEASNLLTPFDGVMKSEIVDRFSFIVNSCSEKFLPSQIAIRRPEFERLGLTDSVLLTIARTGALILTADFPLFQAAQDAGLQAINFTHLRDQRPDFSP